MQFHTAVCSVVEWHEVESEVPYLAPTKRTTNIDDSIVDLMDILGEIDENSNDATLNEVSILSSDGSRIYL